MALKNKTAKKPNACEPNAQQLQIPAAKSRRASFVLFLGNEWAENI
jgi:hypothetical protein